MVTPDPNNFTGKVEIFRVSDKDWREKCRLITPYRAYRVMPACAGLGAAEMVDSLGRGRRRHRLSRPSALFHALEVMTRL